jgi:flagellar assembly factor FliW
MVIKTSNFGEIEINEDLVYKFKDGLPGFEEAKEFVFIDNGDPDSPFKWMQCVKNGSLAFAVVNPFMVKPDYDVELSDEDISNLRIEREEDVLVYSIVVVPEDLTKISMNLKAPLILNGREKIGAQVILDTDRYNVRHYILEELHKQGGVVDVSSHKEEGPVYCYK